MRSSCFGRLKVESTGFRHRAAAGGRTQMWFFAYIVLNRQQLCSWAAMAMAVSAMRGSARYANGGYRAATIVPGAHTA